ncbi:MAG: alpha-N-acetylglucosaminidase TIM-barrel domain-containing protein [Verrucomicrobiae bacterium]|nr:alpha-N-acetylglucosaminidase TIM-barrel domain-containing protein [Verrucomicrobiae bacterium]
MNSTLKFPKAIKSGMTVVIPEGGEKAYAIAGEVFAGMWEKITGVKPALQAAGQCRAKGPLVVIGSDAVNALAQSLVVRGKIREFAIRYGTDDYHILSMRDGQRPVLLLAGGCGRSTLYAVYDFFKRRAKVSYFWDGDVAPQLKTIRLDGCDFRERPRFAWRGLRYFAHRGLSRFQAEHWNLDDWKKEIDWLLKKRLNIFMLRIGIDDLFQRAFPESCPYPPNDGPDPDAVPRSYEDRTSLWPLKYRGELRQQVLQYAFDRGLIHPEDVGTITHWYSHTPSSFYKNNPNFPVLGQNTEGYDTVTGRVWDIHDERTWQAYWRLTQTHLREFGQPRLFHTIGLAERKFGRTDEENLKIKLFAYRKIQSLLRRHYPDAPLLIASWDFIVYWKNAEVRQLLRQFDPEKTVVLDYTADHAGRKPYKDWGLYKHFPWIFGMFHAFAPNSEISGDYKMLAERLSEAAADPYCRGMVLWSELSHGDTFLLEYLASNSWRPQKLSLKDLIRSYCGTRYPAKARLRMGRVWDALFAIAGFSRFNVHFLDATKSFVFEPHFRILTSDAYCDLTRKRMECFGSAYRAARGNLPQSALVFKSLADLTFALYDDPFWRRDAIDIARTVLNQVLRWTMVRLALELDAWRKDRTRAVRIRSLRGQATATLRLLGEVLSQHEDYSLHASLERLSQTTSINPHSEQTLKGNAENPYCRTYVYELLQHAYLPEFDVYFSWIDERLKSGGAREWRRPKLFAEKQREIQDHFYATPLHEMAPVGERTAASLKLLFAKIAKLLEGIEW